MTGTIQEESLNLCEISIAVKTTLLQSQLREASVSTQLPDGFVFRMI